MMLHPDYVNSISAFTNNYFRHCFACWLSKSWVGWTCPYSDHSKMQISTMKQRHWKLCLHCFSPVCGTQHIWKLEGAQRWEEVYQTEKALVLLWPVIPGAQGSVALPPADMLGWFEVPSCQNLLASLSAKWPSTTHQSVSSKFVNISIQRYTLYLLSSSLNVIMGLFWGQGWMPIVKKGLDSLDFSSASILPKTLFFFFIMKVSLTE